MADEEIVEGGSPGQVKDGHTALSPLPTSRYCHWWRCSLPGRLRISSRLAGVLQE